MKRSPLLCTALLLAACNHEPKPTEVKTEIARGAELELRYDFDGAAAHFAIARRASVVGSEPWLQATLGLAVALHHQVPLSAVRIAERAIPLYEEVFHRGGRSPLAARAALHLGRAAEERDEKQDESRIEDARAWYRRVTEGWPESAIAGEATLRLAESYIQTLDAAQAKQGIALSEARAEKYPAEPWAASLWQQAGDAWWVILRDRKNAVRCLLRAEAAGLPDPSKAWITIWRIATLAEEAGLRDEAVLHFSRLVTDHPSSGKAWEAQQRLRALGVEPPRLAPPLALGRPEAGR